jgi:HSP20 family protein
MTETTTLTKRETDVPEGAERTSSRIVFQPRVDIRETADAVWLQADMPGVDESSTDITLEKNVLTVRGTVAPPHPEGYSVLYTEYRVGDFERTFAVSAEVDRDGIEASVKNGVLSVRLPKSKQAAARKIAVHASR